MKHRVEAGHKIKQRPPAPMPYDQVYARWLNSTPGTVEALQLFAEVRRRHGLETANIDNRNAEGEQDG